MSLYFYFPLLLLIYCVYGSQDAVKDISHMKEMHRVYQVIFTCPLSNILIEMQILHWVIESGSLCLIFARGCHILAEIIIFCTAVVIIMVLQ